MPYIVIVRQDLTIFIHYLNRRLQNIQDDKICRDMFTQLELTHNVCLFIVCSVCKYMFTKA